MSKVDDVFTISSGFRCIFELDLRIFSHQDNINLPIFTVGEGGGQLPAAGQLFQPFSDISVATTTITKTTTTTSATATTSVSISEHQHETGGHDVDAYIQKAETVFGRKITGLKKKDGSRSGGGGGPTTAVTRATTATTLHTTTRATTASTLLLPAVIPSTTARPTTTTTASTTAAPVTTAAQSQLLRSTSVKGEEEKCDHPVEAYLHKAQTLFGRKVTGVKLHQADSGSGQTTRRPAPVFSNSSPAGRRNVSIRFCAGLWIRIRLDLHSFSFLDPDPHSICRSGSMRDTFREKNRKMQGDLYR